MGPTIAVEGARRYGPRVPNRYDRFVRRSGYGIGVRDRTARHRTGPGAP